MIDSYDPRSRMAQMQANRGQPFRDTPDGVPGGLPQNQAALAAVQPSYTSQPYPSAQAPEGGGGPSTGPVAHPYGSAGTLIANAYQQHLGRTPSVQEIGSHIDYGRSTGANNILTALNNIRTSQEAQQRMQGPQAQPGSPVTSSGGVPGFQDRLTASSHWGFDNPAQAQQFASAYGNYRQAEDAASAQDDLARARNGGFMAAGTGALAGLGAAPSPGLYGARNLLPGAGGYQPPTGGITGGMDTSAAPAAAPNYTSLGQYANRLRGYDMSKFANPYDQMSEKYKIGLVQSHFDPTKGVDQAGFLDALRSLGLAGGVTGSGDQLGFTNPNNSDRVRMGTGGTADVIYGLKGQNADTAWQPWFIDETGGMGGGGMAPQGGGGMSLGFPMGVPQSANPLTGGAGSAYADMVLKYLAQQLGLSGALAGR